MTDNAFASADQGFVDVLERSGVSVVASMSPDIVACFGAEAGALTQSFTGFPRPFGLSFRDGRLAVSSKQSIDIFCLSTNLAATYPDQPDRFDGVFMRVSTHHTGGCATHELALDGPGVVFVNTHYSCIARCNLGGSIEPLWRPPFVTALMPEDRCHLNGMALRDGRLHFASVFAPSDAARGYRALPIDSGQVIDVVTGGAVMTGLIRPHSPRLIGDALVVLNSGTGEVLRLAAPGRPPEVLARLPGFTRGLAVAGDVLLVGLSTHRATADGLGLPVAGLAEHSGIAALDGRTGRELGRLVLPRSVAEVMDLALVPGLRRLAVHPTDDAHIPVETPQVSFWTAAPAGATAPVAASTPLPTL